MSTNHPNTQDVAPDPELQEVADYWLDFATKRGQTTIGRVTGSFTRTRNAAGESTMGDRVDPADVLIDGERLDLKRNYRLATMAYTFVQGDGYPALAEYHRPVRQPRDFENFVKFVRTREVLTPAPLDRVAAKNAGRAAHAVEVPAPSDEPRIGNNLSYESFQIPC